MTTTSDTDTITCPLCGTEGWPASLRTGAFSAHCGTTWDQRGFHRQAQTRKIIASLRFEVALLQMQEVAS